MTEPFWKSRWEAGQIGFHQADTNPVLTRFVDRLDGGERGGAVYVPLAGKSVDVHFLRERGHRVVATELVALAVEQFFDAWKKTPNRSARGAFEAWEADGVTFLVGDALALTPEVLGPVDAIFDRAALIALPKDERARYGALHAKLVETGQRVLLVTLEHDTDTGPPYSVTRAEVEALFGRDFTIEELASTDETASTPNVVAKGATTVSEHALLLVRR